jgi:hypothetical protein
MDSIKCEKKIKARAAFEIVEQSILVALDEFDSDCKYNLSFQLKEKGSLSSSYIMYFFKSGERPYSPDEDYLGKIIIRKLGEKLTQIVFKPPHWFNKDQKSVEDHWLEIEWQIDFFLSERKEYRNAYLEMTKTFSEIYSHIINSFKEEEISTDSGFKHSPDFRAIFWEGKEYALTPRQAQVVEILYCAYQNGTPSIGQHTILDELDSPSSRLRDTFKKSPLWDTLIIQGIGQGTRRLNL